jgi:imidazolonepropionase-like amidohydrolase
MEHRVGGGSHEYRLERRVLVTKAFSLFVACLFAWLPSSAVGQAPTLVIDNGRVVIGDGTVLERASVVISGDRIVRVSDRPVAVPGVRRIDASGKTVLPGLIDAHVHLTISPTVTDSASLTTFIDKSLPPILRGFLAHGVTTIRSDADYWPAIGVVRDRILAGEIEGPRLLTAGPAVTFQSAHPATSVCSRNPFCRSAAVAEVSSVEDARKTVARLALEGVDFIKVVSDSVIAPVQIPDDVMSAIIAQAHKSGVDVVAHIAKARHMREAAEMGLDGFIHSTLQPLPTAEARELSKTFVQHNTPVTTTLSAFLLFSGVPIDSACRPGSKVRAEIEEAARPFAAMAEEGVQVVVGTDWCPCGPVPNRTAHRALQAGAVTLTEMEMLGWGGLSTQAIIAAATINAARALRLSAQLGTLEVGKLADVVVVDGNPLQDITALRNVRTVVKSGRVVVEK